MNSAIQNGNVSLIFFQYPKWDNRTMFNAIVWLARSDSLWEDIPSRYPPHQSIYSRFCKWRDDDTLETVFHILNVDADLENLSIKAHPQSAGAKKGQYNPFISTSHGRKKYQNSYHCV